LINNRYVYEAAYVNDRNSELENLKNNNSALQESKKEYDSKIKELNKCIKNKKCKYEKIKIN